MNRLPPGRWVENGTEWLTICPKCGREKLHWNPSKRMGFCVRCEHTMGKWDRFTNAPVERVLEAQSDDMPHLVPAWNNEEAAAYLRSRGQDESMPEVYFSAEQHRLFFPLTPVLEGLPKAYHTRHLEYGWKVMTGVGKRSYVYAPNLETSGRVVIVEGIFDALAIGPGAIAICGTSMSEEVWEWIQAITQDQRHFLFWMDPDEAGKAALKKLIARVTPYRMLPFSCCKEHEPSECTCVMLGNVQRWIQTGSFLSP